VHYLNASYGLKSWLLTTDHKRIALLYLASVTFFFLIGGLFATMIRIHLLTPGGFLVSPETYNKLFTMHGVTMVFFFLIPSIPAINSDHDRRQGFGVSQAESSQLVHLHYRRLLCPLFL
jgi:cytochrome c oxidase subunit 1